MTRSRLQEWTASWGWVLAIAALVILLGTTYYLDVQNRRALASAEREAASGAERQASALAEGIGAEVASRIGALAAAKVQFTQLDQLLPEDALAAAVDSVIADLPGLSAVNVILPDGTLRRSPAAQLGRTWQDPLARPAVADAYRRAVETQRPAATPVLELLGQRRFVVFDPVMHADSPTARAVLAAEFEPLSLLRSALQQEAAALRPAFYDIFDPAGTRVTTVPAPEGWPRVVRPVKVADTEWLLAVAHQPLNDQPFQVVSAAIRISGILLALGFSISLFFLWRTVRSQQLEIRRRHQAEALAQENAAEAARRAVEARELSSQLASAQEIAVRLSSALDPDRVIDDFLGAVAEALHADVALLYEFDETGDVAVGRHRLILNPAPQGPGSGGEDFRQVRVPVSLVPHLSEPVATGEPYLAAGEELVGGPGQGAGVTRPTALLTMPLSIGGHLVGLAVWEAYGDVPSFHPSQIPFVRAVSAQAAATLRAAELLEGVRVARQRAAKEATRLATVLDQLGDGVVLFDARGRPERANPAALSLLGDALDRTPLSEWTSKLGVRPGGWQGSSGRLSLLGALRGEPVDNARLVVRRGATEASISASAAPIRASDGTVRGAAVVLRDVTAEHEYAEMLRHTNQELREQATLLERANEELRAATTAKDQFLAMMSHELRTPINAIIGYSDLLDIGVHGQLNSQQRGMLARVVETSRHLLGLINDVLDLTKIGAGRFDLEIRRVRLSAAVERAVNQVAPAAGRKGLALNVDGDPGSTALADEKRLAQILINLTSNAVKFTESGEVRISYESDDERVRIRVHDTGPGIPLAEHERVFEEFHQVEGGHARSAGGTGLGLAISRRLARLMGGEIRVESEPGRGATFTVELPSARAAAPADAEGAATRIQRP